MGSFRKESVAKRIAISAIAFYALLLQGFLAASAPAVALDFPGGISCSLDGSNSGTPGGDPARHHGLCCILACAAASCAYGASASTLAVFPPRVASALDFAPALWLSARPPLKYNFTARGPPISLWSGPSLPGFPGSLKWSYRTLRDFLPLPQDRRSDRSRSIGRGHQAEEQEPWSISGTCGFGGSR
jgi:hypothetical protein